MILCVSTADIILPYEQAPNNLKRKEGGTNSILYSGGRKWQTAEFETWISPDENTPTKHTTQALQLVLVILPQYMHHATDPFIHGASPLSTPLSTPLLSM